MRSGTNCENQATCLEIAIATVRFFNDWKTKMDWEKRWHFKRERKISFIIFILEINQKIEFFNTQSLLLFLESCFWGFGFDFWFLNILIFILIFTKFFLFWLILVEGCQKKRLQLLLMKSTSSFLYFHLF